MNKLTDDCRWTECSRHSRRRYRATCASRVRGRASNSDGGYEIVVASLRAIERGEEPALTTRCIVNDSGTELILVTSRQAICQVVRIERGNRDVAAVILRVAHDVVSNIHAIRKGLTSATWTKRRRVDRCWRCFALAVDCS